MLGYSVEVEEVECTEKYDVCFLNLRPTTPTQLPPRMFLFVCVCRFYQPIRALYGFINLSIYLSHKII